MRKGTPKRDGTGGGTRGNKGRGGCVKTRLFLLLFLLLLSSCSTVEKKSYYKSGAIEMEFKKTGFTGFSNGDGKVINLPLANPSIIGK